MPEQDGLLSIDYPLRFYRQMSPLHLNYICTLNGMDSPDLAEGFTYCELGCGSGATVAVLAAADARGRFVGIDYADSHVADARQLADGLDNAEFILADLLAYDPDELPDFDYITMHGVWTWVPADVRDAILRFVERKLKPGGVLYVSYNALPGWSSAMPLRRYIVEAAERLPGGLLEKVPPILAELGGLMEHDAVFFKENPLARRIVAQLADADAGYFAHEYLSGTSRPTYFRTVNEEFSGAGLSYVGNAMVLDNLIEFSMPREFVPALKGIEDPLHLESVRDFIVNRKFRADVYRKPGEKTEKTTPSGRGGLGATLFGLVPASDDVTSEVEIWGQQRVNVKGPLFERLKELLAFRALTLDEIRADPAIAEFPDGMLVQAVLALSASGQLAPFAERGSVPADAPADALSGRVRITAALNRTLLAREHEGDVPLASPVAGTGLHLRELETLLLRAVAEADPVAWMWAEMQRRGAKMMSGGETLRTEAENVDAIRRALAEFRSERLPQLAYLGFVAPAE